MTHKPEIILIAAVARNGVIGADNALPWRLRGDLQHFKATTMGHPILMGRATWESLGRPLPGRLNLVVSRQTGLQLEGAEVFASLDAAVARAQAQQPTVEPEIVAILLTGGRVYVTGPANDGAQPL